jgi:hypothetical protein
MQPGSAHSTFGPAIEAAWPTEAFRPMMQNRGSIPPFTSTAPPAESGQPAARARGRWCPGASLAPKDSIGTGLVERGSLRRPTNGEKDSGGEAVIGGADER